MGSRMGSGRVHSQWRLRRLASGLQVATRAFHFRYRASGRGGGWAGLASPALPLPALLPLPVEAPLDEINFRRLSLARRRPPPHRSSLYSGRT